MTGCVECMQCYIHKITQSRLPVHAQPSGCVASFPGFTACTGGGWGVGGGEHGNEGSGYNVLLLLRAQIL